MALTAPEVLRRYHDDAFTPPLPALGLRWDVALRHGEQLWELPEGVSLMGPPPARFGFDACRLDADTYSVRLLWDATCLSWPALSRVQLLTSALAPLLAALNLDLWTLLDRPLPAPAPRLKAA